MSLGHAYLAGELHEKLAMVEHTHTLVVAMAAAIEQMEYSMATAAQQLTELKTQLSDTTSDVLAKIQQLTDQLGTLPADAQATLDEIKAGVESLDEAVGDADGSENPATPVA